MLTKDEIFYLINEYESGSVSFAEVLLASGLTVKDFTAFMKENGIEVRMNFVFLDNGKGLSEGALERVLGMNESEKES